MKEVDSSPYLQVSIAFPADLAPVGQPLHLCLELWQRHTLLSHCSVLLLPTCLQAAAAELQGLPWGEPDSKGLAEYVADLATWLEAKPPSSEASQQQHAAQRSTSWQVGVVLLHQAVQWDMTCLAAELRHRLAMAQLLSVGPVSSLPTVSSLPSQQPRCSPAMRLLLKRMFLCWGWSAWLHGVEWLHGQRSAEQARPALLLCPQCSGCRR